MNLGGAGRVPCFEVYSVPSLLAPGVAVFFMVDPGDLPPLGAGVAGLPGSLIFGNVWEPEMADRGAWTLLVFLE